MINHGRNAKRHTQTQNDYSSSLLCLHGKGVIKHAIV